ncbi:MAG: hypothetical protein A2X18_10070 [Bacteroidetes bacterium GWF2_40_14]|nr:MAG: hypothetical protein A2X18_10070 [Bacteroidetes bacterium GWF2_40_14]
MNDSMILGLVQNVAILLAFSLLYDLVWRKEDGFIKILYKYFLGTAIGIIGIVLMMTPWVLVPGLTFDTRSILLLNSGLFFGPIPTIISMTITALYRIYLGGAGVWMGVAVIVTSGSIGILWKKFYPDWRKGNYLLDLFKVSMLTHIVMLACTVFLPKEVLWITLTKMALPVLVIYPIGSMLLGRILISRLSGWNAKNALKLGEERYVTFINANSDCMFVKDEQLRYIIANEATCRFFSKTKEEILNKTDQELASEDLISPCPSSDKRALEEGVLFSAEEKLGERIYEITKFPVNLSKGKKGVGGIMRDVTQSKKRVELQQVLLDISRISLENTDLRTFLGKVHSLMKKVIKADNFYIAIYNKEANKYSCPYFVDEYDNFETDELMCLENTLTDYVRITGKGKRVTAETEKEIREEYNLKDIGEYSPVWMGAPLMDSTLNKITGVVAVQDYHDANAYSLEDLLILEIFASNIGMFIERLTNINSLKAAKDKAEESDRLKTAFLANISHEIRTPMNGIIGFTDILMGEVTDERQKEYISIVNSSAYRLMNIVNDVIDMAKIEAGQVAPHKETFDVNEVLDDVYMFYNKLKFSFDFKVVVPSPDMREIYTDKTKLQQIFSNLVSNAIKFTTEGSVQFGYKIDGGQMIFFVQDTGIGIAKENLEKVFSRFYQVESGNQRIFEGTGLGLSIVKEYVNILGGDIWVESEPGVGTKFYFTIK